MTHKKILPLFFSLVLITTFAGCSKNNTDTSSNEEVPVNRWELTKENVGTAQELTFSTKTENQQKYYCVADYQQILNGPLTKDDILFFDFGKAYTIMTNEHYLLDYLDYNTMKACSIEFTSITTDDDLKQFTVVAPKGSSNKACVVVNKDKTLSGEYLFATIGELLTQDLNTAQEEFESKYGKASKGGLAARTVSMLASGLGTAIAGAVSKEPGVIGCGFVTLINGFVGLFTGLTEPTIRDCLEKLYIIESRITELDKKMSKNFSDIRSDNLVTQAKIDKAITELAQQNIDEFEKEEMFDLEKYSNVMSNNVQEELKNVCDRVNVTVEVPYYYDDDNVLAYRPLTEVDEYPTDKKVTVTIPSFTNALAALAKSKNAFNKTVYNEFSMDVFNACEGVELPEQMTKALLCDYAVVRIVEEIVAKYYSIKKTEGIEYLNLVLKFAKRISGAIGASSVINSYKTRFEYMYNFASEAKRSFNTVLARLRSTLETQYANCVTACIWCGTDYDKLATAYDDAMDIIIETAKALDATPDGYSYIIGSNVSANLYSAYTESYFSTHGNYPNHHNKFCLYRYKGESMTDYDEIDSATYISKQQITKEQHNAIIIRMGYLVNANVLDKNITYYDYLIKTGVLPSFTTTTIKNGIEQKKIKNNPYQFISAIEHRELTNDDEGKINCYFTDEGLEKMHYFTPGEWVMYKKRHSKEYWHATCWETYGIDAEKNTVSQDKWLIGLEGCFDEGHGRWITDERFRFNNGPDHLFFLAMAKVIS